MGGSQIWLEEKETLTVEEMLKAICLASANDCVVAMSEFVAGSEEEFVARMNSKARELGMHDTTFKNPHGLDVDDHVTSAYDIALMSRELLTKHPSITKYTSLYMDTLRGGKTELVNTNKLVRNYQGCTGLKTGSTSVALYNLSASATRDGLSLIAVIMHSPSSDIRFAEAQKLLNYGFANFTNISFGKKDDIVGIVKVQKGMSSEIKAVLEEDASLFIEKSKSSQVVQNISLSDTLEAPIEKGVVIGQVTYSVGDKVVKTVNVVANQKVEKLNFITMTTNLLNDWFRMMR